MCFVHVLCCIFQVKQLTISLVRNVLKTDLPKRAAFVQAQKILPEQTAVAVLTGNVSKIVLPVFTIK